MRQAKPKNWYFTILAVAKRELGLDEDEYRNILAQFGAREKNGKVSASTMTIPQLVQALEHFKKCGFKVKSKKKPANFKDGQMAKCKAVWDALHKAGVMRVPYSDEALTKFAYRVTNVNHIKWATPTGLAKTIEALKGMAQREGVELERN